MTPAELADLVASGANIQIVPPAMPESELVSYLQQLIRDQWQHLRNMEHRMSEMSRQMNELADENYRLRGEKP